MMNRALFYKGFYSNNKQLSDLNVLGFMLFYIPGFSFSQNFMAKRCLIIVPFLLLSLYTFADDKVVIHYDNPEELFLIGKQTFYLEDADQTLNIEDILRPKYQEQFTIQQKDVFNRPATNSAFWYKFTVENSSDADLLLEVASTYAWYIDFYSPDSNGVYSNIIKTGTMRPESSKIHDVQPFWLPLNTHDETEPKTYYVHISSGLTYELPLHIGTIAALSKNKDRNDYLTAGFLGLIAIMFLYHLFLYFSTKDKIYIFYLGYLFLMGISMPYANGYPFIQNVEVWFFDKAWWNNNFLLWHTPVYFFIGEFCIRYLNLKKNGPLIRKILYGELIILSGIIPLLTLIGVAFVDLVNFTQLLIVIFYLTCLFTGYYFAYKKLKQASYYALGWTFMVVGAIVFFAVANGFIDYNPITRNTLYFGVGLEVWMFSLALGNRLNTLQKEKDKALRRNIILVQDQNKKLEERVEERTEELIAKNQTLSATIEELQEMTEKLNVQSQELQELNNAKDQVFAVLSHDLRSPMISLKSLLYLVSDDSIQPDVFRTNVLKIKEDVEHLHVSLNNVLQWAINQMDGISINKQTVSVKTCIDEVTRFLNQFACSKGISIKQNLMYNEDIKTDVDIFKLVLRNFIYNAIKFTPEDGTITIETHLEMDKCIIAVHDTGVGIAPSKLEKLFSRTQIASSVGTKGEKGTGLGLVLCAEFSKKNGGDVWAKSVLNEGSSFYFTVNT